MLCAQLIPKTAGNENRGRKSEWLASFHVHWVSRFRFNRVSVWISAPAYPADDALSMTFPSFALAGTSETSTLVAAAILTVVTRLPIRFPIERATI